MTTEILTCGCPVKLKKDKLRCSKCGRLFCPKHIYSQVDESNRAITKHAHLFCWDCSYSSDEKLRRAADNHEVNAVFETAKLGAPKPVKVEKHRHQWRRGVNSICLICGKSKPKKSEMDILHDELWKTTGDYVKARDKICVTCGATEGLTLSHYIKCGKQRIRYDLRNCNCQCSTCNGFHNHYPHVYEGYMRRTYGNAVLDELEELAKINNFKWSVIELRDMLAERQKQLEELTERIME